jgi:hypothetical protein
MRAQDSRTGAVTLTATPPEAEVPAPVVVPAGGPTGFPTVAPRPTPVPEPVSGSASGPLAVSAALLPVMKDLPPVPSPVSGNYVFGHEAGFQLVNCTPVPLDISTYDQHDGARAVPNKKYTVLPKSAVNCMANGNNAPFDIQYTINNNPVARAPQSIRLFAVQVGPCPRCIAACCFRRPSFIVAKQLGVL